MKANDDNQKKQYTHIWTSAYIGASAGLIESLFTHPLWVLKARNQCNYPFTLNPIVLSKGLTYSVASSVLISMLQISSTITISEKIKTNCKSNSFTFSNLQASIISGVVLGFIATPLDVVMVQQQKSVDITSTKIQNDFWSTANKISIKCGYRAFFCGAPIFAAQFALYNCGVFIGAPYIGNKIDYNVNNHTYSSLIGGGLLGLALAFATQPLDTIGRLQQDESMSKIRLPAFEHARKLYNSNGSKEFFRGITWRCMGIVVSTAIISTVVENSRPTFSNKNKQHC